jgi:DNA-binding transcriptional ArsR family regulator
MRHFLSVAAGTQHDEVALICQSLAHPVRLQVLEQLRKGAASPVDLAERDAVDGSIGTVSYHVRTLRDGGLIEVAAIEASRGALKTSYALTHRGELVLSWLARLGRAVRTATPAPR